MGTSSSSRGSGTRSPLVPDWAQIDGAGPVAAPGTQRFRSFRTSLGGFVASGDGEKLRTALGHFARTATGGRNVGPRRFGAMAQSGGALVAGLAELAGGRGGAQFFGVDLSQLAGTPTRSAIQEIVKALTPNNGDTEKIKAAMDIALSEALEGIEVFDPAAITEDVLVAVMIGYMSNCVFDMIMLESGDAFEKTADLTQLAAAEKQLHELVKTVIDEAMRPMFAAGVKTLTAQQMTQIQLKAVQEVWTIWEGHQ